MNNQPKKMSKFGSSKLMFTPNLGYKRIAAKDSDQQSAVEVKMEYDASSSTQSTAQKQKKVKEKSLTQTKSVFSNLSSISQGSLVSSRMKLSSGFETYPKRGTFNTSGSFVKTENEGCQTQSIQQMQLFNNNQFDMDDPLDNIHGPVRLPLFKKDILQIDNSLEYPSQKNVYPMLSELLAPESLLILQFYDSSFSYQSKIPGIELIENDNNCEKAPIKIKTEKPIKVEYNGHNIKTENDSKDIHFSQPIGKVQYYRSGRVVLVFNDKKYELLKANEDKHHKELFSLTNIEDAERPDKLVSLGTVPLRLKAVMDINCIIENFVTLKNN